MPYQRKNIAILALGLTSVLLSSCGFGSGRSSLPPAPTVSNQTGASEEYIIGPLDEISIFVWRNPDLSGKFRVRPDGRITSPLISDLPAAGKTSAMLAQDIKIQLSEYINDPIVQVIVTDFDGGSQQVRVIGATEKPAAIPFRANMTLLDAMIAVGGLSEFASGNKATLIRVNRGTGRQQEYALRINDLLKRGSSQANIPLQPGDVIIIPTSSF